MARMVRHGDLRMGREGNLDLWINCQWLIFDGQLSTIETYRTVSFFHKTYFGLGRFFNPPHFDYSFVVGVVFFVDDSDICKGLFQ